MKHDDKSHPDLSFEGFVEWMRNRVPQEDWPQTAENLKRNMGFDPKKLLAAVRSFR